jgi:hypothetical protein
MRTTDQLAVEVHYFPISAAELSERSRTLRGLFLRGARRAIQQNSDRECAVEIREETGASSSDLVEK